MKKLHIFTIILTLIAFQTNYAQEEEVTGSNQLLMSSAGANLGSAFAFDISDKTVRGSAYIQKSFMPAKLSLMGGTKIYKLKYNAFNDEIEIENEGQESNALNKNIDNLLIVFVGNDKTYEAIDYLDKDGNTARGYFVHVNNANSKHQLLIQEAIKFVERKPAKTGYDKVKPAEFKRLGDKYFVAIGNDAAVEFPKKKKDFSKVFPGKHNDILSFIKKNKIKTSKEEDLIELINYINTL